MSRPAGCAARRAGAAGRPRRTALHTGACGAGEVAAGRVGLARAAWRAISQARGQLHSRSSENKRRTGRNSSQRGGTEDPWQPSLDGASGIAQGLTCLAIALLPWLALNHGEAAHAATAPVAETAAATPSRALPTYKEAKAILGLHEDLFTPDAAEGMKVIVDYAR